MGYQGTASKGARVALLGDRLWVGAILLEHRCESCWSRRGAEVGVCVPRFSGTMADPPARQCRSGMTLVHRGRSLLYGLTGFGSPDEG